MISIDESASMGACFSKQVESTNLSMKSCHVHLHGCFDSCAAYAAHRTKLLNLSEGALVVDVPIRHIDGAGSEVLFTIE